ncbi:MAG TPA: cytosine permease, partial [Gaiellaceae bacterium]|nr:cytosine permease [Gaiellaceae bacterium]
MEQGKTELAEAVQLDQHGIEPIRAEDRTSTPWRQFWIWAGANLAPINWVLGALGPILGLSLIETMLIVVIGNVIGCAMFGLFCLMGYRTGVNQMVLSRAAFGRRGAYLPATAQMLMTMGWLGVNTWVVLDLVLGIFKEMGYDNPGTGTKYAVGIAIMAVQVVIAIFGFYLIQAFEKYTVPVA